MRKRFYQFTYFASLSDILQANHISCEHIWIVPSDQLTIGASGKSLPHKDLNTSCINCWELQWTFSLKRAQPQRHGQELNCLFFLPKNSYYILKKNVYIILNLQMWEHVAHTISSDHWFVFGSAACEWQATSHPSWPKGWFHQGWTDRFKLVVCSTVSFNSEEGKRLKKKKKKKEFYLSDNGFNSMNWPVDQLHISVPWISTKGQESFSKLLEIYVCHVCIQRFDEVLRLHSRGKQNQQKNGHRVLGIIVSWHSWSTKEK